MEGFRPGLTSRELSGENGREATQLLERADIETQNQGRLRRQKELLTNFYRRGAPDWLKGKLIFTKHAETANRGLIFEELALSALPPELTEEPELSRFILETMRKPTLAGLWSEPGSKDIPPELSNVGRWTDGQRAESRKVPIPDSLIIREVPTPDGGKIPTVTGVVEIKSSPIEERPQNRTRQQLRGIPRGVKERVEILKPHFADMVHELGLSPMLPEQIDCLDPQNLKRILVTPEGRKSKKTILGWQVVTLPFSKEESEELVDAIYEELIENRRLTPPVVSCYHYKV